LMGLSVAEARAVPWQVFVDADSGSSCDVVNGADSALVVLSDTGQLVVVSGVDLLLVDTFVDADQIVYFNGIPSGEIAFAEDGDGFLTVWWLSPTGWVMDIDLDTQEAVQTDLLPTDFVDVPCDACGLWDDPADCDTDLDGVSDGLDACSDTPLDEEADLDGCSCSQLDDDMDGIDNCFDLCPDTPLDDPEIDLDGCSCSDLDDDLDGVDNCFDLCPDTSLHDAVDEDGCPVVLIIDRGGTPTLSVSACGATGTMWLSMTLCGLVGLRLSRRW